MQALGLVEVVGLAAGYEAADVACKTANVELVGYELAKGGGYVTIKVLGQVGAVTAAVAAAADAASRINRVVSKLVIPRPADQVDPLVKSALTVGYTEPQPEPEPEPQPEPEPEVAQPAAPEPEPAAPADPPAEPKASTSTRKAPAKPTTERKKP